jgi:hypothetical protein
MGGATNAEHNFNSYNALMDCTAPRHTHNPLSSNTLIRDKSRHQSLRGYSPETWMLGKLGNLGKSINRLAAGPRVTAKTGRAHHIHDPVLESGVLK